MIKFNWWQNGMPLFPAIIASSYIFSAALYNSIITKLPFKILVYLGCLF